MHIVKIILSIIFIIDCIALTVVVLMQEGKQQGLGSIAGAAETYWGLMSSARPTILLTFTPISGWSS